MLQRAISFLGPRLKSGWNVSVISRLWRWAMVLETSANIKNGRLKESHNVWWQCADAWEGYFNTEVTTARLDIAWNQMEINHGNNNSKVNQAKCLCISGRDTILQLVSCSFPRLTFFLTEGKVVLRQLLEGMRKVLLPDKQLPLDSLQGEVPLLKNY